MFPDELYQSRKGDWLMLTQLLSRGEQQISHLTAEEIQTLGRLYRAAASDLAIAQRDFPRHPVTTYLNQLVARAHTLLYRNEPVAFHRLWQYITTGFPRLYRQTFRYTLTAMLLLIIPALIAGLGTAWKPDASSWLLPGEVQRLKSYIERQELWVDISVEERPYTSSFIMQNNIQVAILAFGSGVTAGIYTTWVMIQNGLILGGLTGLTAHYGVGFELWTFVIGHGVIELSVICMAGGAGLMLGWALIRPGLLRRRDALILAARKAVQLLVGGIPLLVVAGLIEGFISPAEDIAIWFKWMVGLGSGVALYAYLIFAGRERQKGG
jgi:uncharacterized membrane protein SpoIIM required for sporulation